MGFRARRMAGNNFWDLAESNRVPHAQVGEGRRFSAKKAMGYSLAFWGVWASEPDQSFYAWNRCLGVPGVSSWGSTAISAPSPSVRGLHLAQASFFQIKGPKWPLGPV